MSILIQNHKIFMKKIIIPIAVSLLFSFQSCKKNDSSSKNVAELAKIEDVWIHLEEFQKIADNNNNNRAVGSPGGIASAEYITNIIKNLGLQPTIQEFKNQDGKLGKNIIIEIKGESNKVSMIGAHYDSVESGPGINDNATGTSILLEILNKIQKNKIVPKNTLRFAFWDAEETGVAGSKFYVSQLKTSDFQNIAHYINIDMVGTKNPTLLILDGDGSSWEKQEKDLLATATTEEEKKSRKDMIAVLKKAYPPQVKGADELEKIFADYLTSKKIPFSDDYLLSNNTDVFGFLGKVPTFGIVMTNEQTLDNGELLFAPCYHQKCDDIKNVDKGSIKLALDSILHLLTKIGIG